MFSVHFNMLIAGSIGMSAPDADALNRTGTEQASGYSGWEPSSILPF
jgi:hypothetical protein